ncbi:MULTISPECIES: hypothetical protein [Roseomonadaceae]|uniref:Uncharacterized protein n=1 Tax=Falsiroseomonas oleicola TaxID=2801474 RepID=A0ABS6H3B5_9PROT|nr:hypothetical protein [Roseomonas oleicola]MBU8543165.1 hypothetical protein [Roseomonas oleicola]
MAIELNLRDDPAPFLMERPQAALRRRAAAPLAGFALGAAAAAAALLLFWPGTPISAGATTPAIVLAVEDRAAALDTLLRQASARMANEIARAESAAQLAEASAQRVATLAERGPMADRFMMAALLLQSSVATPRPWLREYQAMVALAPPGALPRPLAEVLASHAARGLPAEAELRERFNALAPQLLARAPSETTLLNQATGTLRGWLSGIADHLRRGNLAGAVADAGALDPALQPLVAGWLAQARARMAVEQAVQETLLRALNPPSTQPTLAAATRRP